MLFGFLHLHAQDSTKYAPKITWSGFVDVYSMYNLNRPASENQPSFLYNHNSSHHVSINLALLKVNLTEERVRANIGLMSGTYAKSNLAAEPDLFQMIYEANGGVKLSKKHNLWLDAGIMTSHIGFESAISKDCWTLTRSMAAENSPYYHCGAELTYTTKNEKWLLSLLYLNGWQRMVRVAGNTTPAGGWQITYSPNSKMSFNSCSFVGNDKPDSLRQMRYFHHFNFLLKPTEKFGIILGIDNGMQEKIPKYFVDQLDLEQTFAFWYTPNVVVRTQLNKQLALAFRGEYYSDVDAVIIGIPEFATTGVSANIDWTISSHALLRLEGKWFNAATDIFEKDKGYSFNNCFITTSLAAFF